MPFVSDKICVSVPDHGPTWSGLLDKFLEDFPDMAGTHFPLEVPRTIHRSVLQAYVRVFLEGGVTRSDVDACLGMPQFSLRKMWDASSKFMDGPQYKCPFDPWMLSLHLLNEKMGRMAITDDVARHTVFRKPSLPDGAYHSLVSLHPKEFDFDAHRIPMSEFDLEHGGFLEVPEVERPVPNLRALRRTCLKDLPRTLPWLSKTKHEETFEGVIAAGGRLVSAIFERKVSHQDIDLFVVANSSGAAAKIIKETLCQLDLAYPTHSFLMSIYVKPHVTDVLIMRNGKRYKGDRFVTKYQIIHKAYPTPSHVVHGFDIDVCGVLFDGRNAYATANAARAVVNGFNLYDQNKMSSSAEHRYAKYMLNYGFRTLVVGVPEDALSSKFEDVLSEAKSLKTCGKQFLMKSFAKIAHTPLGLLRRAAAMLHLAHVCNGSKVSDYSSDVLFEVIGKQSEGCMDNLSRIDLVSIPCACSDTEPMFTGAFNPVIVDLLSPLSLNDFV